MPILKNCEQCHKDYTVTPARANKSRFCCMTCRNANDRTSERRTLTCANCSAEFAAVQDHGVWPKFCCRECFLSQRGDRKKKKCASCGETFEAGRAHSDSDDRLHKYCSKSCQAEGLKNGKTYQCLNCGTRFYLSQSVVRQRGHSGCCSRKCATAFYLGEQSASFKRGFYMHTGGEKHLLFPRPGYSGKYTGEHRVVAGKEIGRLLTRSEVVIRINRNPKDNRPENLFICESNSECGKRLQGSLPWPSKSNLSGYALAHDLPQPEVA